MRVTRLTASSTTPGLLDRWAERDHLPEEVDNFAAAHDSLDNASKDSFGQDAGLNRNFCNFGRDVGAIGELGKLRRSF